MKTHGVYMPEWFQILIFLWTRGKSEDETLKNSYFPAFHYSVAF